MRSRRSGLLACAFLAYCAALVAARDASWSPVANGWKIIAEASPEHELSLTVGLKLEADAVTKLERFVEAVSDPDSPQYGRYMNLQELTTIMAPPSSDIEAVRRFFVNSCGATAFDLTQSLDFAVVTVTTGSLAACFTRPVKFHVFEHVTSGRHVVRTLAAPSWSWDSDVEGAVQLVLGVDDFLDTPAERKGLITAAKQAARASVSTSAPEVRRIRGGSDTLSAALVLYCPDGSVVTDAAGTCGSLTITKVLFTLTPQNYPPTEYTWSLADMNAINDGTTQWFYTPLLHVPKLVRVNATAQVTYSDTSSSLIGGYLTQYSTSPWVTPRVIYEQYGIPISTRGTNPANSQAVTAFEQQYISVGGDLAAFFADQGLPFMKPIIHGANNESSPGGESSLDIQYVMGVGAGVPSTFWSVSGDPGNGGYILAWALQVGNTTNPPLVTSISYGDTELGYFNKFGSWEYIIRMNIELAKMAARGLTVMAGSGDAGVSNVGEDGNDLSPTDPTCTPFRPFYPSNSPYVLSVSSTFLTPNALPVCEEALTNPAFLPLTCDQIGERSVSVRDGIHWTTGGGFSNFTATQPWQADAVLNYIATQTAAGTFPPTQYFNKSGRAYPDVATIGHNLLIRWGGSMVTVDGTSASGPIMAGVVSLLNEARLNAGKSSLGLLNPMFYKAAATVPGSFRDVVVGSNFDGDLEARGSPYDTFCPYGFVAAPGWDPVSGLGSPNYAILKEYVLSLQ